MNSSQKEKRATYKISDRRVTLSPYQTIGHYACMLLPLLIPALDLFYKLSGKTMIVTLSNSIHFICMLISLMIGYLKWKELFYYSFEQARSNEEFENAVLASATKLNWVINRSDNTMVEATALR